MKKEGYVYLNEVPTRVVTWGKWIEDPFEDGNKELILCIPGNPGVTKLYESFLQTIYDTVRIPIWIVGHSGHEKPKNYENYIVPDPKENEQKFNLETQINNKKIFIEKYVPKDVKIHLLGHSVGSYTILHLLESQCIKQRIIKNYFLFPTIEYLGDSVNGIFMTRLIKPIVPFILFMSWIFTILPSFLQKIAIYLYCKIENVDMCQLNAIIDFVDPYVLRNVFTMAYDQIGIVRERPNDKLKKNLENIKMYYGKTDNWVPDLVPINIKNDIPEIDIEICERGIEHSFVLCQSREMGEIVGGWLISIN